MKMKKYLIMVSAIAISGVFVGCHEDELSGSIIEQKKMAFEDAFIQAFGQPDPTHNWGFRMPDSESLTRAADPRGNMWESEGWNVPPVITDAQKDIVRRYFQQNKPLGYNDPGWTDFWIQQVYKGGTKTTGGSKTTETYKIGNGDDVVGGDHMDHLCSKSASGTEDHINDFNNSDNNDWEGRMLMRGSSTHSFGYINSNATAIHYDKAALVNWRVIAQWAVDNKLEESVEKSVLNDGWNRSYMGFDWEQAIPSDCYSGQTFTFDNVQYRFLTANTNQYAYDQSEPKYHGKYNVNDKPSDDIIRELLSLGYLPYSDTYKDWIKLSPGSDGYYSDWIVTLTQATNSTRTPSVKQIVQNPGGYYVNVQDVVESGRVMCEDLAGASGDLDDLDYNDIVFDAVIVDEYKRPTDQNGKATGGETYDHQYFATVRLMAAGGTIPIEMVVGGQNFDVHYELGSSDNVMINTLSEKERASVNGAQVESKNPKTLINKEDKTTKFYGVKYIRDITLNVLYANVSTALVDSFGAATYKFLVPLGTKWAKERIRFSHSYPKFPDWVYNKDKNMEWYTDNVPSNLYAELEGLNEDDFKSESAPVYIAGSETYSKTPVSATSTMSYPGASEKTIYNFAATGAAPGFLCPALGSEAEEDLTVYLSDDDKPSIAEGQTVRIYGVNIADWYVSTNISGSDEYKSFNGNGNYIDIPVTSINIDQIKSGITIEGKHFTVTYVTIVGLTSTPSTPTVNDDETPTVNDDETPTVNDDETPTVNDDETPSGDEITYSGTEIHGAYTIINTGNRLSLAATLFSGVKSGSIMRIYGHRLSDNWRLEIQTAWSNPIPFSGITDSKNITSSNFNIGKSDGCIELVFSEDFASEIARQQGMIITGEDFSITKITLE